jgi:Mn-dependent DtxR family transcriptional regulator
MAKLYFTERDAQCLRAVYFLGGDGRPVGPTRLARVLGVTRVTAMSALRRLAALGFGEYLPGEGFLIGREGVDEVENSIWRHHVVERLITQSMGMSCDDACSESSRIQFGLSDEFVKAAYERLGRPDNCDCGCALSPPYDRESLSGCNWCRQFFEPDEKENPKKKNRRERR